MEGLGNKYAVAALTHKRATLAGEIAKLQASIDHKRRQLEHVDATLTIFGATDPDKVRPIKPYKRIPLFKQGELARLVRDAFTPRRKASHTVSGGRERDGGTRPWRRGYPGHAPSGSGQPSIPVAREGCVAKQGAGSRVLWSLAEQDALL
jgi:hypothetical protein